MLEWVSAAEGHRFVEAIRRMEKLIVEEDEIEMSKMIFSQPKKKTQRRKAKAEVQEIT